MRSNWLISFFSVWIQTSFERESCFKFKYSPTFVEWKWPDRKSTLIVEEKIEWDFLKSLLSIKIIFYYDNSIFKWKFNVQNVSKIQLQK